MKKFLEESRNLVHFFMILSILFGTMILVCLPSAHSRNLQGRVGLGYNAQFSPSLQSNGPTAISLKYAPTRDVAFSAIVGALTGTGSSSVLGGKFFKNLFFETNLNFYYTAGLALASVGGTASGIEILSGVGTEFFIPGLDSVGLSMEIGASVSQATGSFRLRTMGVSFLNAGMHFYF